MSTEHTPIDFEDIQVGDTVRREWEGFAMEMTVAVKTQVRVENAEGYCTDVQTEAKWFLIDRPKPAVGLPIEPTLGWLTTFVHPAALAEWSVDPDESRFVGRPGSWRMSEDVTEFIPAVAVPKAALDEARREYHRMKSFGHEVWAFTRFFVAVDEANS